MKILPIYFFLFAYWLANTAGFSLTGVKGLSLVNLSLYFLLMVWAFNIVLKRRLLVWNSVNTFLILLIFVVILSIPYKILLDEIPFKGLRQEIIWIKKWIEPFIIFFIMSNILDDKRTCKKALFGLIIFLLITLVSTQSILLRIINFGHSTIYQGREAAFSSTGQYAAFLVLLAPLVLTFVLFHKSYTLKICSAVTLFASLVALIVTGSRGGILAFLVCILSYLFMLYQKKIIRPATLLYIMIAVLIFSTVSIFATPTITRKLVFGRIIPNTSESITQYSSNRLTIWQYSLAIFAQKPIFGHGKRATRHLMAARFGLAKFAHNQYLTYLVEHGIIGCFLFILIYLKIFQVVLFYQRTTSELWEKKLYISYLAGLVGYTVSMLFDDMGAIRNLFWFYTAVFLRYGQLQEFDQE